MKQTIFLLTFCFFLTICSPAIFAQASRPAFSGHNFYYGDLHGHSGYSQDGVGEPDAAYDTARSKYNDFYSLTEHDEAFISNPYLCLSGVDNSKAGTTGFSCAKSINLGTAQKWQNLKTIALNKNQPGQFVAFYGFEWTHSGGHLNVFEAPTFVNPPYTLDNFYSSISQHSDKSNLFVSFNHPASTGNMDFRLPVGSTDQKTIFTYRSTIAPYAYMIETNNFAAYYPKALKKGYKLGATGYGDGHNAAQAGTRRYGILATDLSKESLISAIKNRQTFGVLDGRAGSSNFPLAIALKVNGQLMGGATQFNGSISYQIYVRDDLKKVESVELRYGGYDYSSDNYQAAVFQNLGNEKTIDGTFSAFAFSAPKRAKFVYAVAKQRDSKNNLIEVAWSSPVWINYQANYTPQVDTSTPTPIPPTTTPSMVSPSPTLIPATLTPTQTPSSPTPTKAIPTPTVAKTCFDGCYGSQTNCSINCGIPCTKFYGSQVLSQCGWASTVAYRCCR
ncbi:MAG: hypothetical protein WC686_03635 [Candidatus Shapirobacteria bacterium]|jgi:hypothetical protein